MNDASNPSPHPQVVTLSEAKGLDAVNDVNNPSPNQPFQALPIPLQQFEAAIQADQRVLGMLELEDLRTQLCLSRSCLPA